MQKTYLPMAAKSPPRPALWPRFISVAAKSLPQTQKNIIAASKMLVEKYDGKVPSTRQELMALPGVGQKTAGVVLLAAFGDDQIPVDTHVFRVSNRIGLCSENTPEKTEKALREALPRENWSHAHHLIIWHGRRCCSARKPACERCPLRNGLCEYFKENNGTEE